MNYEMIVAVSENGVIGNDDKIPWNIKEDLTHFKNVTENHVVVMGMKTFLTLPKKPLKNRINIVLTREKKTEYAKYMALHNDVYILTLSDAVELLDDFHKEKKIFIIGGSEIYEIFYPKCSTFHITVINKEVVGNVYFPFLDDIRKTCELKCESDKMYSESETASFQFLTYKKI
jgi:dihydrofolate reductase